MLFHGLNIIATIFLQECLKIFWYFSFLAHMSFTPLFLLTTPPIIIREIPGIYGERDILIVVFGAYYMDISQLHKGLFAPLKYLWKENDQN